ITEPRGRAGCTLPRISVLNLLYLPLFSITALESWFARCTLSHFVIIGQGRVEVFAKNPWVPIGTRFIINPSSWTSISVLHFSVENHGAQTTLLRVFVSANYRLPSSGFYVPNLFTTFLFPFVLRFPCQ
ncbi:hypothetical protein H1C71_014727, partial [Ictidomys tridecemlineatus]